MQQASGSIVHTSRAGLLVLLLLLSPVAGCLDDDPPPGSVGSTPGAGTSLDRGQGIAASPDPTPILDALAIKHPNRTPTRIAEGPGGRLHVTDAGVGAVFLYDAGLQRIGELSGLDRPLGVAVDEHGQIYVGNDGRDDVEVYGPAGEHRLTIGEGQLQMPNDLALDHDGNLYVVDSRADTVRVYDADGSWVRDIGATGDGDGGLQFPAAIAITYRRGFGGDGELFVGDQGHGLIQVFDLHGAHLRTFGGLLEMDNVDWQGKFARIQSLDLDDQGQLHVLDSHQHIVQVLDPDSGAYLDSYGEFGTGPGQLNVTLDIAVTGDRRVVATNAGNHRVEVIHEIP